MCEAWSNSIFKSTPHRVLNNNNNNNSEDKDKK